VQEYLQPLLNLLNPEYVVSAGYVVMTLIIFAETGLLIGFCLPGDSLLVTAGIFASRPEMHLSIWLINLLLIPAAIVGDTVGYWFGYHSGPRLFRREKSFFFRPEHLLEAQRFYERHGGKTIVLARFMPIIRTFAPVVAGMGRMDYRKFLFYNVFGGIGWILSMSLAGYWLGRVFPGAVKRLEVIILVVVFISILPGIITYFRKKKRGEPETLVGALADPDPMDDEPAAGS
jgi:membrane-associated protein